nr:immunoglobulin heavy chain junction region [Macaca mulatta]
CAKCGRAGYYYGLDSW